MRKILLLFVVLGGIIYFSGCGNDDKTCNCTKTYTGTGSENLQTETYSTEINEDYHCSDVLNSTTTDGNGLTTTINCVGY